jgi:hypothetical protein
VCEDDHLSSIARKLLMRTTSGVSAIPFTPYHPEDLQTTIMLLDH